MSDATIDISKNEGALFKSLSRNPSKIRLDRAKDINDDTARYLKRDIEDLQDEIVKLKRRREAALDLSGESALSTKPAVDFNVRNFLDEDHSMTIQIREKTIAVAAKMKRYNYLCGEFYTPDQIPNINDIE